jgi:nitroreductase
MEFQQVVDRRRMVRRYDDRPVDPQIVERVLENALHAPSAGFSQGWGFLVLESAEDREAFWSAATPPDSGLDAWLEGMRTAPVIIVTLSCKRVYLERYAEADKGWTDMDESHWPVPYWDIDTGMAALLMLQTVVDEGLGACFFGIPPEQIPGFRATFGVPDDYMPIGAVSIGHRLADQKSPSLRRGRKPVDEVVHRGRW